MKFRLDDVTLQTAHHVDTAVSRWQPEPNSASDVITCLCAVDADGQLILFEQSSEDAWKATNLSDTLHRRFSRVQPVHSRAASVFFGGPDASDAEQAWQEALILPDDQGRLVICHHQQGVGWEIVDISAACSVNIDRACRPVVWEQHHAAVHSFHLLAVAVDGRLLEFTQEAGQSWQCCGAAHTCKPASLSLFAGEVEVNSASPASKRMAFSVSQEGLLYCHSRCSGEPAVWRHELISSPGALRLRAHSTAAFDVDGVCHVAACDVLGSVLIYQQSGADTDSCVWLLIDITAQTGCRARAVGGVMLVWAKTDSAVNTDDAHDESTLVVRSPASIILTAYGNGRAYRFWWNKQQDWQVTDVHEVLDIGTRVAAHAGLTSTQDESLALVTQGRLVMCHGLEELRSMSWRLVASGSAPGHPGFARRRHYVSRVVAWQGSLSPVPELRAVGEAVFGSRTLQRNAASYLDYVSGSAFTLQRDDVLGWFSASDGEQLPDLSSDHCRHDSNNNALPSSERIRQRFQQAIHFEASVQGAADADVPGLESEAGETSGLMIIAHHGDCRSPPAAATHVLWSVNRSISVIELVQEILATCIGLPRLPREAEQYDLMALDPASLSDDRFLHPNGAWKLLMGWVRARMATRTMRYRLRAVADSHEVIVLAREGSQAVEYFVIENRQCRPMDDVSDPGLLVWHVLNHSNLTSDSDVSLTAGSEWLVTLASASTGDATSGDPLLWADGDASGYTLSNVSPAADVMSFDLELSS